MSPDSPEALGEAFIARWNANDGDGLGRLFDVDARFVNVVGLIWHDREAIARNHQIAFDSFFRHARGTIRRMERHDLADGVAALHVHWRMTGQIERDGREGAPRRGILLLVCRRGADGWSIAVAQNTDLMPGHVTVPSPAPPG